MDTKTTTPPHPHTHTHNNWNRKICHSAQCSFCQESRSAVVFQCGDCPAQMCLHCYVKGKRERQRQELLEGTQRALDGYAEGQPKGDGRPLVEGGLEGEMGARKSGSLKGEEAVTGAGNSGDGGELMVASGTVDAREMEKSRSSSSQELQTPSEVSRAANALIHLSANEVEIPDFPPEYFTSTRPSYPSGYRLGNRSGGPLYIPGANSDIIRVPAHKYFNIVLPEHLEANIAKKTFVEQMSKEPSRNSGPLDPRFPFTWGCDRLQENPYTYDRIARIAPLLHCVGRQQRRMQPSSQIESSAHATEQDNTQLSPSVQGKRRSRQRESSPVALTTAQDPEVDAGKILRSPTDQSRAKRSRRGRAWEL